jgi:integrase/recombinase XerD
MEKQIQIKEVPEFVEKFLRYMKHIKKKDTSENTITAYRSDLYYFLEWLKEYKNISIVTLDLLNSLVLDDLHSWICSLTVSASTESRKVSAIHSLFEYLNLMELINNKVAKGLKKPEIPKDNTIKYLPPEQVRDLLEAVKIEGNERDCAIILLFLNAGLRISELIKLNLDNIKNGIVTVKESKGKKSREVPINQDTVDILNDYLKVRPKTTDEAFFLINKYIKEPYRITRDTIVEMLDKYAELAGIEHLTAHMLRHTYGTGKRRAGVSLDTIKELMGHETIDTVLIYAQITREEKILVADMGSFKF